MNKQIAIYIVAALIIVAGSTALLLNRPKAPSVMQTANLENSQESNNWMTYQNETLGIQFMYPSNLKANTSIKNENDVSVRGEQGSRFTIVLKGDKTEPSQMITFNGVGKGYSAPRGGDFLDTQGYVQDDHGKYYYVFSTGEKELVEPIGFVDTSIGKIILVNDNSIVRYRDQPGGPSILPGGVAALVNLPIGSEFQGFGVISRGVDDKDLIEILKTIDKIENENWKTYRNDELGFEMNYPKEWKISEENIDNQLKSRQRVTIINTQQENEKIAISITDNAPAIPEFSDNSPIADGIIEGVDVHVENFPKGYCDGLGCTNPFTSWWLENNGRFYTFALGGVQNIEGVQRQIISTFKLLNK